MAIVSKADWRRWVENQRAVARVQANDLQDTWGPPSRAIAASLELLGLYERLHGWPPADDPVTKREDLEMWERFARLRATRSR
jgi:hypothetical protein